MPVSFDPRLAELRVLENLADGTWSNGVSASDAAGQAAAVDMSSRLYSDLLVTLFEDGLLLAESDDLIRQLRTYEREKEIAFRNRLVIWFSVSTVYSHVSVIVSDLIHFLEKAEGESVSLLFADVDDFKEFNSEYGYKAGDEVLRNVFRVMRRIVGNHGEVYRRGGEEVIAILPYVDLTRAIDVGERIREAVRSTVVQHENAELHATLSIGVAASPPHDPDGPALETHAENALKQAKNMGRTAWLLRENVHEQSGTIASFSASKALSQQGISNPKDRPLFEAAEFIEKVCVQAVLDRSGPRQCLGSDWRPEQHRATAVGVARSHPIMCISVPVEFYASPRRDGCNDALVAALKIVGERSLVTSRI